MGGLISIFSGLFSGDKQTNILMVGLDGAGKTTILYKLKLDQDIQTTPTIGFNLETIRYRNMKLVIRDVGGQDRLRRLWRQYYEGTHAVVFVVDSNDTDRLETARSELHKLMEDDHLRDAVVLVYANKQDQPKALSPPELQSELGIQEIQSRGFNIFLQPSTAITCEGIYEGLDWLAKALRV
eukprot:TRINITY_DN1182_c3_g1_i1.p1 TRINITY_DN1182_c3_g1~~TRINITY_DN1182_c3_g1_i1.p1  ORF type:complete len:198 (+),score=15.88 TRINITY_DN1182_c3_g1_i1:49-594(+)